MVWGPHMCCVKQQLSRSLPLLAVTCLAPSDHLKLLLTPVVAKTRLYASPQLPCRCSGAVRRACIFINKPSQWIIYWIYHSSPSGDSLKVGLPPFLFPFKKCIYAEIIVTFLFFLSHVCPRKDVPSCDLTEDGVRDSFSGDIVEKSAPAGGKVLSSEVTWEFIWAISTLEV